MSTSDATGVSSVDKIENYKGYKWVSYALCHVASELQKKRIR